MTENQKRRITLMRQNHIGYAAIANELKLPLSTVKAFCRRNSLQAGDLAGDTQIENKSASSPDIDLIRADSRVNSTTAKQPRALEKDEPDLGAVADVLDLLTHANYGR